MEIIIKRFSSALFAFSFLFLLHNTTANASTVSATVGQSVTFSLSVSGTPPFTYQWYRDAAAIAGATAASYIISPVALPDKAIYSAVIANSAGSTVSDTSSLTVNAALIAPSIVTQPTSKAVTAGQSASFTVVAAGSAPLSYQWQKNGVVIGGATSATFTIASTSSADAANYAVVVSNSVGSVTSATVSLTVNSVVSAPSITSQPQPQWVLAGQSARFRVTAKGSAPLSYQWEKNGVVIAGATSATFTITNATIADAADYSVIVSNAAGSVASNSARLKFFGSTSGNGHRRGQATLASSVRGRSKPAR